MTIGEGWIHLKTLPQDGRLHISRHEDGSFTLEIVGGATVSKETKAPEGRAARAGADAATPHKRGLSHASLCGTLTTEVVADYIADCGRLLPKDIQEGLLPWNPYLTRQSVAAFLAHGVRQGILCKDADGCYFATGYEPPALTVDGVVASIDEHLGGTATSTDILEHLNRATWPYLTLRSLAAYLANGVRQGKLRRVGDEYKVRVRAPR
jgi:hypothetical protein